MTKCEILTIIAATAAFLTAVAIDGLLFEAALDHMLQFYVAR